MTNEAGKSRTLQVYGALRRALIEGEYMPGEKLKIEALCIRFEANSSAIREALARLTAERLVMAEAQKGFSVAPISRQELIDLTAVRVTVECLCLRESIANADLEWAGRIVALGYQLSTLKGARQKVRSEEAHQWHSLHEQLHSALAARCPNRWWRQIREQLYSQSERCRWLSGPADGGERDVDAEHNAIIEAALARDADKSTELMKEHLLKTVDSLLASSSVQDLP
jgi:DNA-binding GntR family transcriptional regulator